MYQLQLFGFPVARRNSLGWYRAKDLYPEGMLLNGMLNFLQDNSIVTVLIELKKHGEYTPHSLKALVNQQSEATELLWVNQNADLPDLLHVYRNPAPERVLHGNRSQPH